MSNKKEKKQLSVQITISDNSYNWLHHVDGHIFKVMEDNVVKEKGETGVYLNIYGAITYVPHQHVSYV